MIREESHPRRNVTPARKSSQEESHFRKKVISRGMSFKEESHPRKKVTPRRKSSQEVQLAEPENLLLCCQQIIFKGGSF